MVSPPKQRQRASRLLSHICKMVDCQRCRICATNGDTHIVVPHSFKVKERTKNPKAYIVDTGLQSNIGNNLAQENIGWRMENVIYLELLRRYANQYLDIYYYKPSSHDKEVDFVVCDRDRAIELIQVAYDISSPRTYNREISALAKASKRLKCDNLLLLTFSDSREVVCKGCRIRIVSALQWLIERRIM